ncbi:hypothetical protein AWB99_23430 [Mycolicibacterium confluentis]|nr:hypothetical protein AWB99_23430 [Mycolicibacterium confluentis]
MVSMNVVSRANAGNRPAESRPIAEAAFTTGTIGRYFCGNPTSSKDLVMTASGMAHATASAA